MKNLSAVFRGKGSASLTRGNHPVSQVHRGKRGLMKEGGAPYLLYPLVLSTVREGGTPPSKKCPDYQDQYGLQDARRKKKGKIHVPWGGWGVGWGVGGGVCGGGKESTFQLLGKPPGRDSVVGGRKRKERGTSVFSIFGKVEGSFSSLARRSDNSDLSQPCCRKKRREVL